MTRLCTSMDHPSQWIAYTAEAGWLIFPDSQNGWAQRKPVRGLDPIHLREVPLRLANRAGLPAGPERPTFKRVA